jgi:hypothetical protein
MNAVARALFCVVKKIEPESQWEKAVQGLREMDHVQKSLVWVELANGALALPSESERAALHSQYKFAFKRALREAENQPETVLISGGDIGGDASVQLQSSVKSDSVMMLLRLILEKLHIDYSDDEPLIHETVLVSDDGVIDSSDVVNADAIPARTAKRRINPAISGANVDFSALMAKCDAILQDLQALRGELESGAAGGGKLDQILEELKVMREASSGVLYSSFLDEVKNEVLGDVVNSFKGFAAGEIKPLQDSIESLNTLIDGSLKNRLTGVDSILDTQQKNIDNLSNTVLGLISLDRKFESIEQKINGLVGDEGFDGRLRLVESRLESDINTTSEFKENMKSIVSGMPELTIRISRITEDLNSRNSDIQSCLKIMYLIATKFTFYYGVDKVGPIVSDILKIHPELAEENGSDAAGGAKPGTKKTTKKGP